MKILVINWQDIKNPLGGGAEVHLHEIFRRVVAMGHDVTLFCCKVKGLPDEEVVDGIKVIRKGSRSIFNFYVPSMYFRVFHKEHFDIIIDDINKIPFYTPLYIKEPLLAISHHFFGKSIFRQANFISGMYVYIAEKIVDFVYKKTPFAVVSDSTLNEFVERGFDRRHFKIIPNAITQENFPMMVKEKYDKPLVTYFGRLKKYKSIDHLFEAFANVSKTIPDALLYILGRGDFQPELEELAKKLKIYDKTKFFGFVSEEDKVKWLSLSHVVVNTSMKEGWGITNIETNACGTPVISANVPGLKDSIKEGVSGLLYEYGDINQLSNEVYDVLTNKELLYKLSEGAVSWAKLFTWDESARKMVDRCREVIALKYGKNQ